MSDEGSTETQGATGAALDLWKAQEATRQGDAKLAHQAQSLDGLRGQATSLLGWSVTIGTGLTAIALNGKSTFAGSTLVVMTTATAWLSIRALRLTDKWKYPSYDPDQILDHTETSELRILQSLAIGTQKSVAQNRDTLAERATQLRRAWISFAFTPIGGLAAYLVSVLGAYLAAR